jgi:hypothetical protein
MSTPQNTKDAKAKCPAMVGPVGKKSKCNKDHRAEGDKIGDSIGKSSVLAANLGGAEKHSDYYGPRTLAAHHLISSQILYAKKKSKDNAFWEEVCHAYGYDINCKENGIFLPRKMDIACALKKPLHRGNHDSAEVYDGEILVNTTYTKQVRNLTDPIKSKVKKGVYCNNAGDFIGDMNDASSKIKEAINNFSWTLTYDGRDYIAGGIGCCNFQSITTKRLTIAIINLRGKKLDDVEESIEERYRCKRIHNGLAKKYGKV